MADWTNSRNIKVQTQMNRIEHDKFFKNKPDNISNAEWVRSQLLKSIELDDIIRGQDVLQHPYFLFLRRKKQ